MCVCVCVCVWLVGGIQVCYEFGRERAKGKFQQNQLYASDRM